MDQIKSKNQNDLLENGKQAEEGKFNNKFRQYKWRFSKEW